MPRTSLTAASAALAARDPVMALLVERVGPCRIPKRGLTPFEALARSIVFQQLAGRAATAIWDRVRALTDGAFTAEAVLALTDRELRGAGLSAAKAASVVDLATRVADGTVALDRLSRVADDRIVEQLTVVRGIGPWTAEMFLIFQLRRLDVWPVTDFGVRSGFARAYGMDDLPKPKELMDLGEGFRPYRSVAAWYCWRVVDTLT